MKISRELKKIPVTFLSAFLATYSVSYIFDLLDNRIWSKSISPTIARLFYALEMAVNLTCYQTARIICHLFIRNIKLKRNNLEIIFLLSLVSSAISTFIHAILFSSNLTDSLLYYAQTVLWRMTFEIVGHWLKSEMKLSPNDTAIYLRRHVILFVRLFCAKAVSYPITHNLTNILDDSVAYLMKQPRYWFIDDIKVILVPTLMTLL